MLWRKTKETTVVKQGSVLKKKKLSVEGKGGNKYPVLHPPSPPRLHAFNTSATKHGASQSLHSPMMQDTYYTL